MWVNFLTILQILPNLPSTLQIIFLGSDIITDSSFSMNMYRWCIFCVDLWTNMVGWRWSINACHVPCFLQSSALSSVCSCFHSFVRPLWKIPHASEFQSLLLSSPLDFQCKEPKPSTPLPLEFQKNIHCIGMNIF